LGERKTAGKCIGSKTAQGHIDVRERALIASLEEGNCDPLDAGAQKDSNSHSREPVKSK